ncbi:MAG: DNA recombination protein RmuC [Phycisphaerales bacterium]|nr:DNA recombination protein RmuC [Phycisphaerales bacterium]
MTEVLWLAIGLVAGAAVGALAVGWWASGRARTRAERVAAMEAEARGAQASAEQGRRELDETRRSIAESREALAKLQVEASAASTRAARIEPLERELADERRSRAEAERALATRVEQQKALEERLQEKHRTIEEAQVRLTETFKVLSAEALGTNNQRFLELAEQRLGKVLAGSQGDLEKRQQAIEAIVKPLREALERQGKVVTEMEQRREGAYKEIETLVKGAVEQNRLLQQETGRLVSALRRPEQRGRWGEMQLRNAVELAGMAPHCDFREQVSTEGEDGRLRPDMVVSLPGGGSIVVDAKVAVDAYLDAIQPDADRDACMRRHAQQVQAHVSRLAQKRYWDQFDRSPHLVVMFMPIESALSAAMELSPDLHANAMASNVLIATPTLLVALLRAIAYGWRQEDVARNAHDIADAGRDVYERLATFAGHLGKVGESLQRAGKAYNSAVGSLENRLLPGARKLRELGAATQAEIENPPLVETEPRSIVSSELIEE